MRSPAPGAHWLLLLLGGKTHSARAHVRMDASGAGAVWLDKGVLRRGELSPGARRGAWLALASAGAAAGVALPALPASLPLPLAGGVHAYYRAALHEVFGANVPVP